MTLRRQSPRVCTDKGHSCLDAIIKFSWRDGWPIFLTSGASLVCFMCWSSAMIKHHSLARELSLLLIGLLLKSCAFVLVDECDEHLKIIIIITLFTSKSYQAKLKHFRLYSHKTNQVKPNKIQCWFYIRGEKYIFSWAKASTCLKAQVMNLTQSSLVK